jgi:hypothetical protein
MRISILSSAPATRSCGLVDTPRVARPRDGRHVDWLRTSPRRTVGPEPRVDPATRGALGDCRSGRQGRTCANGSDPNVGEDCVDAWTTASEITQGRVFRAINKAGRMWGDGMSPKVYVGCRARGGRSRGHRQAGTARSSAHVWPSVPPGWRRTGPDTVSLGHVSVQTTERYLRCKQKFRSAVNDQRPGEVGVDLLLRPLRRCRRRRRPAAASWRDWRMSTSGAGVASTFGIHVNRFFSKRMA